MKAASGGLRIPKAARPTPMLSTTRVPTKWCMMVRWHRRAIVRVSTSFDRSLPIKDDVCAFACDICASTQASNRNAGGGMNVNHFRSAICQSARLIKKDGVDVRERFQIEAAFDGRLLQLRQLNFLRSRHLIQRVFRLRFQLSM